MGEAVQGSKRGWAEVLQQGPRGGAVVWEDEARMGQAGKMWQRGVEVEGSAQAGSCVQSLEGGIWARQISGDLGKSEQEAQSISMAEGGHCGEGKGPFAIEDSGLQNLVDVGSGLGLAVGAQSAPSSGRAERVGTRQTGSLSP